MRDQATKLPIQPPPLMAVGIRCLTCANLTEHAKSLAEGFGGEMPPGVRVVLQPYEPEAAPQDTDEDAH